MVQYRCLHRGYRPLRNAPRNPAGLAGPVTDPLTLAINRSFPLPLEGHHLDFRAEAFNALNEPQVGAPKAAQGSGTFGKITGTSVNNRELQLALKYIF